MLTGCSSYTKQPTMDDLTVHLVALKHERHWWEKYQERLVAELEAAKRGKVELEQQVGDLSRKSLTKAKQDLTRAR